MSVRKVSRLTGPQLAEALGKLDHHALKDVRRALTPTPPGTELFLDGVNARLAKADTTAQSASRTDLLRALSLELARLERSVATSGVRTAGEVVSLATVERSFGKAMRALLEHIEGVEVSGRLDPEGRVPVTRAIALEVAAVYELLGLDATNDAVVRELHKLYSTFDEATLDALHRRFDEVLPNRQELAHQRGHQRLEDEARVVQRIVTRQKVATVRDLVQVMQGLGYQGFDGRRLSYLRRSFPELVPSLSKEHTPEELLAIGERIRTFIAKHPAATSKVLGRALSLPIPLIEEAAELAGLALTRERTARILDPYDPLCDALVRFALTSRRKGEGIVAAAALLNANGAFTAQYGAVTEAQLTRYVDEHLPRLARAAGHPPWEGVRPGVYDRAFAELASFFYKTPDIDEPRAFAAVQAFDPSFSKYRLKQLRAENTDLSLCTRVMDKGERERMARAVGQLVREHPGLTLKEIGELAWQAGLPRLDDQRISNLRVEFPELIDKRVDRANAAELADIDAKIRAFLTGAPHASVAEVAAAVGARETQVVKPLRRVRAELLETGQTRFSDVDHALIERVVRAAEPGDTQDDVMARVMADKTFAARHRSLSQYTLREVIVALVPEAADWKVYNLITVARVLDLALQQAPEGRSLSKIIGDIQKEHPGFPNYVSLLSTGTRSMEKHIERMPFMKKYLGADGRLKLSSGKPQAELTEELAHIVAQAFAEAPPDWKNERIFEKLHQDPHIKQRYPVLNESTLTGLRAKFPGVIAARTALTQNAGDAQADATKLAKELQAIVDAGGKITLDVIAKEWGVDPQYFRRLINRNPALFPMYKKRYEITEHVARTMGLVIATMPMGVTLDEAAVLLERSGLFPPDMKLGKTLLLNANAKFPALVPSLNERNQQLFLRMVCKELVTAKTGTTLRAIFDELKAKTKQLPVSLERFTSEIVPAWQQQKPAARPAWVSAAMRDGKVAISALGEPAHRFPPLELVAVERDVAQLAEVPVRLEMLERIIARKARNAFADWNVLSIQHLLGSNFRFVEAVHRLGAKKEDVVTVGIPYSTSETVARTMNEGGLETLTPPLNIAAWERQVEDALHAMVERSKKNGKKIVVFDDGGLVAKILHEKPWAKEHQHLFRIVEQTTRGITVAKKYDLQVPLVNYAQDPAKNLEGSMIGEVVLDRIYRRLDAIGKKEQLKGMPITCVGAGVIGLPTALDLARAGAKVTIYDLDPKARDQARATAEQEGLDIVVADNPTDAFTGAKMIVGSTGHTSIGAAAFSLMADGCMLVSTSSKLVEIDMDLLDGKATHGGQLARTIIDDDSHPPTCSYRLDDGRTITVLADGFPVNFDGAVNCVDPADIQLTHAGMLLAGIQATWKGLDKGLLAFDDKLRAELLADWAEVKAARGTGA